MIKFYNILLLISLFINTQANHTDVFFKNKLQAVELLLVTDTISHVSCNGFADGFIEISVSGGTNPYSFLWSNGDTSENIYNLSGGIYSVTITDILGDSTVNSYTINEAPLLQVNIFANDNIVCFGETTKLFTNVSGGIATSGYNYLWSDSSTFGFNFDVLAGVYYVSVTDDNDCLATDSIQIIETSSALMLSANIENVTCIGDSDGEIDLTVNGANISFPTIFFWSNGSTNEDIYGLSGGFYTVTVTNFVCETIQTFEIIEADSSISNTFLVSDAICFGENSASLDLTVSGGVSPFTYSWTYGHTSEDLSNINAGNYHITISDNNNCQKTDSIVVGQSPELNVVITGVFQICYGSSAGTAHALVSGGISPYSYLWWDNTSSATHSGLSAGYYNLTVTDANGCQDFETAPILESNGNINIQANITNAACYATATGEIDITATNGYLLYHYNWSNGESIANISNLSIGTYSITVTDSLNCQATDSFEIIQPDSIEYAMTSQNLNCSGINTGEAGILITGGSSPYSFLWSNGQINPAISNLYSGTYIITVSDNNNCSIIDSIFLSEPLEELSVTINGIFNTCFSGDSSGTAHAIVSGGTLPYSYNWSTGDTLFSISNLPSGNYSVTVIDGNNCTNTESFPIMEPGSILQVNLDAINVDCYSNQSGSISATISGGYPVAMYSYLWSSGQTSDNINSLPIGNYSVTVTDNFGCISEDSIEIFQPDSLFANYVVDNISCFGFSDGNINLTASGGISPYSYLWSNSFTDEDLINLSSGTYFVSIYDANSCESTYSITITQPDSALLSFLQGTNVNCFNDSTGSIDLQILGGTPSYSTSWSNGETAEDISLLPAGNYYVTITDSGNCSISDSLTIEQPNSEIAILYNQQNVSCYGLSDGSLNISVSGGTSPYSYIWSNGVSIEDLSNLIAGIYTLTVSDINNCSYSESISITQPSALGLSFNTSNVSCFGINNGAIDLSVSGGTQAFSYIWSNSETDEDIQNLYAGTYLISVEDVNGCVILDSIEIFEPDSIEFNFNIADALCYNDSNGTIKAEISGGNAPYTFIWSNGNSSDSIYNLTANTYFVTVSDNNLCENIDSVSISEPDSIIINAYIPNLICYGTSNAEIFIAITGGISPYLYNWSNGSTVNQISNLNPGDYFITINDQNNCTKSDSFLIPQPDSVIVTSNITNVSCNSLSDGSIALQITGGTIPYSFLWSNGDTLATVEFLSASNYQVTITDFNNCETIENFIITEPDILILDYLETNTVCFGTSNGSIDVSTFGGTTPFSFIWSNGETSEDLSNIPAGFYYLTVTDTLFCVNSISVEIMQNQQIDANFNISVYNGYEISCFNDSNGYINISNIINGEGPISLLWSNDSTTQNIIDLTAGTYVVTITDSLNCSEQFEILLNQPSELNVSITDIVNVSCYGNHDASISINVSGGLPQYQFQWNTGSSDESLDNLGIGDYYLVVYDLNSCKDSTEIITISQPNPLLLNLEVFQKISCFDYEDGIIVSNISGGNEPYNFLWSNGQIESNISNIATGEFSLEIIDSNNCETNASIFLDQPAEIIINAEIQNASCVDNYDAYIALSVDSGFAPYSYQWSIGEQTDSIFDLISGFYEVTVSDLNNCSKTNEFEIIYENENCLSIPSVFTPNADGYHDEWEITNIHLYQNAVVEIYNRWSKLIFKSVGNYDNNKWDGKYEGKNLPIDAYFYIIDLKNGTAIIKGDVSIIR